MNGYGQGDFPGPLDSELKLYDAQTLTGNTRSTEIDLGGENFRPHPALPIGVVLNVQAIKTIAGNEAYAFKVQQRRTTSDGYEDTGLTITVSAVGNLHKIVGVDKPLISLLPVIGGTSPSITLSAWLTAA
jgi:hypothetical protein